MKMKFLLVTLVPSISGLMSSDYVPTQKLSISLPLERIISRTQHIHASRWQLSQQCNFIRPAILSSFLLQSEALQGPSDSGWESKLRKINFENDEVVRVLDANTVKLKRIGLVSFASVQTPSGYKDGFRFPDCMAKSPSSNARLLLPQGTKVKVKLTEGGNVPRPRALIVSKYNGRLVNAELVRNGFARPINRGRDVSEKLLPGLTNDLFSLQRQATESGLGMYRRCELAEAPAADDQFEPLDYTVETQYGDDGGKPILRRRDDGPKARPANPGDVRKCADFDTYEDALRWYERYFEYYGDVARLDRNSDGVPCPGLPHTVNQSKYRMKIPVR
mmetsp:Transcript_19951/g.30729  ORF Transcript_19951/g.30729 Transcript_19951/m.30729 type:complete len:333 (+) Transcript_19951:101-1099(+)